VATITNPRLLLLKFLLFIALGTIAGGLILVRTAEAVTALLLVICVWSFSRAYYFCFYVIERYIDSNFRFSGIFAALRFAWCSARRRPK
jgi:hypothetical protein